ncbi:MAG: hypothetical protein M4579_005186 [Chaenotheca gracillima]|nr:MAG: hypothetical protein M4579_005186 [Chaenotheca gracillima]
MADRPSQQSESPGGGMDISMVDDRVLPNRQDASQSPHPAIAPEGGSLEALEITQMPLEMAEENAVGDGPRLSPETDISQMARAEAQAESSADLANHPSGDIAQLYGSFTDTGAVPGQVPHNVNVAQNEPELSINDRFSTALAEHHEALNAITRGTPMVAPTTPTTRYNDQMFEEPTAPPSALENTPSLPATAYNSAMNGAQSFGPSSPVQEPEGPQIQAFAKLEFDDGPYYMNTHSIELGRDVRAAKLASKGESETRADSGRRSRHKSSSAGDVPQTPLDTKRDDLGKLSRSVVSETGGIMGMDSPDEDDEPAQRKGKKLSKKSKSTSSSSQQISRKNSTAFPNSQSDHQSSAQGSFSQRTSGAHPVDPLSLLPSPEECPLLAIHPPADCGAGHRGISRKHVKIAYNFDRHYFELQIMGRNGAFVDDRWHAADETIPLKSGSHIQIGAVGFRFALPDVPIGKTGAETSTEPGAVDEEMALVSGGDDDGSLGSPEGEEEIGLITGSEEDENEEEEIDEEDGGSLPGEESEAAESEGLEQEASPSPEPIPKKRGPGRPPKNGISKRAQAQIAREAKAKAKAQQQAPPPPPAKNKVGRPRKNALPEEPQPKPEKRKYTKRKGITSETPADANVQSTSQDPEEGADVKVPKEKKKKPPKSPRSPTPEFDPAQLPPQALEKPQASYVVLIHEALTNSKTGAMSLPQIYKAIQRKYPFFVLRTTTNGWQSSVRHNLGQHPAFRKIERSGKGWMWAIVPGVSIEKEKRRKSSPPPPAPHSYIQQQQLGHAYNQPHQPKVNGPGAGGSHQFGPPLPSPATGTFSGPEAARGSPNFPVQPPFANGGRKQTSTYQSPYATSSEPAAGAAPQTQPRQPSTSRLPENVSTSSSQPTYPPSRAAQAQAQNIRPNAATPATPQQAPSIPQQPPTTHLNPTLIGAVNEFKMALIKTRPNDKRLEAIVNSAINRGLGLTDKSSLPGGEDPQERQIMNALWNIMKHHQQSTGNKSSTTPQAAKPKPLQQQPAQQQQQQAPPQARAQPAPTPTQAAPAQRSAPQTPQGNNSNAGAAQLLRLLQTIGKRGTPSPATPAQTNGSGGPRPGSNGSASRGASAAAPAVQASQGSPEPAPVATAAAPAKRSLRSGDDDDTANGSGGGDGEPQAKRVNIAAHNV